MNVYIAAHYPLREKMRWIRSCLAAFDIFVTSKWLDQPDKDVPKAQWKIIAVGDLDDMDEADVLIVDTTTVDDTGGREFEAGYACDRMPFIIVGPERSVFHSLANKIFADWNQCIRWLAYEENRRSLCNY